MEFIKPLQMDRKSIIDTIVEADNLCLEPVNEVELYKEYAELDDHNLIIELISTLKLANRQIRFLENQRNKYKTYYNKNA